MGCISVDKLVGRINLHRKILDWEWYSDVNTCRLFIHMLLRANWREGSFKGTTVPRGSFVSSLDKLSEETSLTKRELRTAISHLKTTGELTVKTTNRYSVFTVENYSLYQHCDTQNDPRETCERHSNDILTTTIEEDNKEKKKRKYIKEKERVQMYFPDDKELNQAFIGYVEMRKQMKKPMTDRAIELAIKKLQHLAVLPFSDLMDNKHAIQILNQSVMNGWQGLFPLKEQGPDYQKKKGDDTTGTNNQSRRSAADYYEQILGTGDSN